MSVLSGRRGAALAAAALVGACGTQTAPNTSPGATGVTGTSVAAAADAWPVADTAGATCGHLPADISAHLRSRAADHPAFTAFRSTSTGTRVVGVDDESKGPATTRSVVAVRMPGATERAVLDTVPAGSSAFGAWDGTHAAYVLTTAEHTTLRLWDGRRARDLTDAGTRVTGVPVLAGGWVLWTRASGPTDTVEADEIATGRRVTLPVHGQLVGVLGDRVVIATTTRDDTALAAVRLGTWQTTPVPAAVRGQVVTSSTELVADAEGRLAFVTATSPDRSRLWAAEGPDHDPKVLADLDAATGQLLVSRSGPVTVLADAGAGRTTLVVTDTGARITVPGADSSSVAAGPFVPVSLTSGGRRSALRMTATDWAAMIRCS